MLSDLHGIFDELEALERELEHAPEGFEEALSQVCEVHKLGADNLLRYVALRSRDRRGLQRQLADLGAPSLQFPESDVLAKVRSAQVMVSALQGRTTEQQDFDEVVRGIVDAHDDLSDHARSLLGDRDGGRSTRIMVTLPKEAADDPQYAADVVAAGANLVRINLVHDDLATWKAMAENVRQAAAEQGKRVLIGVDLPGTKILTGPVSPGPRVGAALVTRYDDGEIRFPARLWIVPKDSEVVESEASQVGGRAPLTVRVERDWYDTLAVGTKVRTSDAQGLHRSFVVIRKTKQGTLAVGDRSTWIRNHAMLEANYERARVSGIPPLQRGIHVQKGEVLHVTADLTPVDPPREGELAQIGCSEPVLFSALKVGNPVLFKDGAIRSVVESLGEGEAFVRITDVRDEGQELYGNCSINVPDTRLDFPAVTEEDVQILQDTIGMADIVGVSFVHTAEDVREAVEIISGAAAKVNREVGIVVNVETLEAMRNLPEILLALMAYPRVGIMIARADLGAELGLIHMVEAPSEVLRLCEAARVPVIVGSNVLESLLRQGVATRAELTDAAWAQQAEAVMIDRGPHVVETVTALGKVLAATDKIQYKNQRLLPPLNMWDA